MNTEDIDLLYNQEPVCPHCGEVYNDAWEINFNSCECNEVTCSSCGRDFVVCRDVSITYSTYKKNV